MNNIDNDIIKGIVNYYNEQYINSSENDIFLRLRELGESGIYLPIYSDLGLSVGFIREVYELISNGQIEDGKNMIVQYFSNNNRKELQGMIESWEECGARYAVFHECLNILQNSLHIQKPYLVIIPTLLSQIEGIVKDILSKSDFSNGLSCSSKKGQANVIDNFNNDDYLLQKSEIKQLIKAYFGENYSQRDNPKLRNNILHGALREYGSIFDMLQLFIMIDMLSYDLIP